MGWESSASTIIIHPLSIQLPSFLNDDEKYRLDLVLLAPELLLPPTSTRLPTTDD